jgi:lactate dehydrogenase-like 2-hydroxyacid dehydrogenase
MEALSYGINEGIIGGVGLDVLEGERNFIGVERDAEYFKICQERIGNAEKIMKKKGISRLSDII